MSWMKKGPELKLSEIKVPDFLFDLYYDLKERRLLPLVALLALAIVAVPILLSQSSGSGSSSEEEAAIATPSSVSSDASTLMVAKSTPGLRDYKRRLRQARALDPFQQQYAGAAAAAEASASSAAGSSAATSPAASIPSGGEASAPVSEAGAPPSFAAEGGPVETGHTGGGSAGGSPGSAKYASNSLDVRIVSVPAASAASSSAKPRPQVRHGLPELTMLPSRKTPAVVFMGTTSDGKKALLLVSSDVESIFGDGQCVVGSKTCQLLALETGLPETFVYGPHARTYRIEVLKITKTVSAKPRRAALAAPKKGKGEKSAPDEKNESKPAAEPESPSAG